MASWCAEQTLKNKILQFYDPLYHRNFLFKFVFSVHFFRNISTRVGNAQVLRVLNVITRDRAVGQKKSLRTFDRHYRSSHRSRGFDARVEHNTKIEDAFPWQEKFASGKP